MGMGGRFLCALAPSSVVWYLGGFQSWDEGKFKHLTKISGGLNLFDRTKIIAPDISFFIDVKGIHNNPRWHDELREINGL